MIQCIVGWASDMLSWSSLGQDANSVSSDEVRDEVRPMYMFTCNGCLAGIPGRVLLSRGSSVSSTAPLCCPITLSDSRDWAKASCDLFDLGVLYANVLVESGVDILSIQIRWSRSIIPSAEHSRHVYLDAADEALLSWMLVMISDIPHVPDGAGVRAEVNSSDVRPEMRRKR